MNDSQTDDARLDKAEAQMRRALGLTGNTPARSMPHQSPIAGNGSHPQRRQFVRDGDVPVTIVRHHDHSAESINQLEAARSAMRSLATAKERAERLLEQAQAHVRDLQTKLAHERMAKDEVIGRLQTERQTVEHALETVRTELAAEKISHERAEQALRDAQVIITDLSETLHGTQQALATMKAELAADRQKAVETVRKPIAAITTDAPANGDEPVQTLRRPVGRPRKLVVVQTAIEPVRTVEKGSARSAAGDGKKIGAGRQLKPVKWWLSER